MAHITYRVTGRHPDDPDRLRITRRFRNTEEGRAQSRAFADTLRDSRIIYDVEYRTVEGRKVTKTFTRRREADAYSARVETDKQRGATVDPRRSRVSVEEWCRGWLAKRTDLRPTTRRQYTYLLNVHIVPRFGNVRLAGLTASDIGAWHATLRSQHPAAAARGYQVLRAALNAAVTDGVLAVNPCKVKGGGANESPERPSASVSEVYALAKAVAPRWRTMVLLAFWCSLRLGELRGLQRRDLDLLHGWVDVREQIVDVGGTLVTGPPKTKAGRRRIAIPPPVREDVAAHLDAWVDGEPTSYVFTGASGIGPLPSATWRRAWSDARRATGLSYRFHDLRHAGNTLAATTGASTRELMARMGHASTRAALIYQHATSERDQVIAAALAAYVPPADVVELASPDIRRIANDEEANGASTWHQ